MAAPATAFVLLFVAGSSVGAAPSPFDGRADVSAALADGVGSSDVAGCLLLLSVLALAAFGAVAFSRLTFLAPNAPGPAIAGFGGMIAAVLLAVSALCRCALGRPELVEEPGPARALNALAFFAGGPAHTAALALLIGGLAVTAWFVDRTPRRLTVAGFVIAGLCLLSGLAFAVSDLAPLTPVSRAAAMLWMVVLSCRFPRHRGPRRT